MRPKINSQPELDFQPSNLKLTNGYFAKYEAISKILDANSAIVDAIHRDLERARRAEERGEAPPIGSNTAATRCCGF